MQTPSLHPLYETCPYSPLPLPAIFWLAASVVSKLMFLCVFLCEILVNRVILPLWQECWLWLRMTFHHSREMGLTYVSQFTGQQVIYNSLNTAFGKSRYRRVKQQVGVASLLMARAACLRRPYKDTTDTIQTQELKKWSETEHLKQ